MDKRMMRAEPGLAAGEVSYDTPAGEPARGRARHAGSDAEPTPSGDLADAVINHIIPRLLLAHRMDAPAQARVVDTREPPTTQEVETLATLAVAQDLQSGMDQIEAKLREGLTLDTILLDWIAMAARLLGEQWMNDERSFADVTLGMGTLHQMMATLRQRLKPPPAHRGVVVFLAAPGEQHTLAIHVLGDLFSHAGWETVVEPNLMEDDLVGLVTCESVVMVGISVSCSTKLSPLGRIVNRVQQSSLNSELTVVVGGPLDLSAFADDVGAIFCSSARSALTWLERHTRISL